MSARTRHAEMNTMEMVMERLRRRYSFASDEQLQPYVEYELAYLTREGERRPLTLHEVAARWYSYDKVVHAIAMGDLKPKPLLNGRVVFDWLHVLAVDIPIARMRRLPHPDVSPYAPLHETAEAEFQRLSLEHRKQQIGFVPRDQREPRTNIYFIEAVGAGLCKIGKANDVEKRLLALRTGSPHKLKLKAVLPDVDASEERRLHREFSADRAQGEWFKISDALKEHILRTRRAHGLPGWAR